MQRLTLNVCIYLMCGNPRPNEYKEESQPSTGVLALLWTQSDQVPVPRFAHPTLP